MGASKLRNVYKVTNLSKPILVNSALLQCEACDKAKIRTHINQELSKREDEPLALVYIDICGPFDKLLRGYRFFIEIHDNYTRKCWIIPI
jgi:hypothetical protein